MSTPTGAKMKTLKWLIKREFWEHKGGVLWAPIIVAAIMFFFMLAAQIGMLTVEGKKTIVKDGQVVQVLGKSVTPELQERLVMMASDVGDRKSSSPNAVLIMAAPLFGLMALVIFFVCLNNLYDERKDRSVLFWKSLPVNDGATVFSKVALVLIVAPIITCLVVTFLATLSALLLFIALVAQGMDASQVFKFTLGHPGFYWAPFKIAALIPLYALWALPAVGWLMLTSAFVRSKPFLWALGIPLLTGGVLMWANRTLELGWNLSWFGKNIISRMLAGVIPGHWVSYLELPADPTNIAQTYDLSAVFERSWQLLGTPDLWIGVAVGIAMLYVAGRVRRWRDDG